MNGCCFPKKPKDPRDKFGCLAELVIILAVVAFVCRLVGWLIGVIF